MSKWKPGQLVTINHHVFRVVKVDGSLDTWTCSKCDLYNICGDPDFDARYDCISLIGVLCYFKRVI